MEDQLINLETAKLADEKGFNIKCYFFFNAGSRWELQEDNILRQGSYDNIIECPTQSLLQRWLREIHNINVCVQCEFVGSLYQSVIKRHTNVHSEWYGSSNKSYEEALEIGLQEALKLL